MAGTLIVQAVFIMGSAHDRIDSKCRHLVVESASCVKVYRDRPHLKASDTFRKSDKA